MNGSSKLASPHFFTGKEPWLEELVGEVFCAALGKKGLIFEKSLYCFAFSGNGLPGVRYKMELFNKTQPSNQMQPQLCTLRS